MQISVAAALILTLLGVCLSQFARPGRFEYAFFIFSIRMHACSMSGRYVSCGRHHASTCDGCVAKVPWNQASRYCNGNCKWSGGRCIRRRSMNPSLKRRGGKWDRWKLDFLFILIVLGACNCGKPKMSGGIEHHISYGDTADPKQYPWIVYLMERRLTTNGTRKWDCTGAMIDHQHVLTAGHCVMRGYGPPYRPDRVTVYQQKKDKTNKMEVAEIRVHGSFANNPSQRIEPLRSHDIAVLRLKHPRTDSIRFV